MRYLAVLMILFFSAQVASAQSDVLSTETPVDLGNGVFMEIIPAEYVTAVGETPEWAKAPAGEEWVTIPATFETIQEKIIVQEAYTDLRVTPAMLTEEGTILQPVRAEMIQVPAVTRTITRRVVKTPARVVKRVIPYRYHPPTVRKRVGEPVYVFRDETGTEIARYEDPLFAMRYIEGLPN